MRKRLYLYRLMIIILILLLPVMFFCFLFWNRSFTELEKNNENYYENILTAFAEDINEKVNELKLHAVDIIAASKEAKSAFWMGSSNFQNNKYYYLEAMAELNNNNMLRDVSSWGIYYYDTDRIITTGSVLSPAQYVHKEWGIDYEESYVGTLFDESAYKQKEWIYAPTVPEQASESSMLIGYYTNIGKLRDKVFIFYVINSSDFTETIKAVYGDTGINFYVIGENNTIYMAMGNELAEDIHVLENKYQKKDSYLPLSYVMHITEDFFHSGIMSFYYEMRDILIVTIIIVLCAFTLALYLAYKPVHGLTKDLEYDSGDEFLAIRNVLEKRKIRITEQEMLIMDLLLNNLVQGLPVSGSKMARLGMTQNYQYYCVMVLEGSILLSDDVEQITKEMNQDILGRLFITDWECRNILIAFMKGNNADMISAGLKKWLKEKNYTHTLRVGNVTSDLNEIRASYLSCYKEKNVQKEVMNPDGQKVRQRKLKKEILMYIESHYRDADLTQTQVADYFQISHYTLSRMFKDLVGVGFSEYLNAKRIELAKELLLTTGCSIKEVSLMVGYESLNYFSRIFKVSTGLTPTEFRNQR